MSDPVSAIRSLPRFAYLSPAEAREVVLAVLGAVREPSKKMAYAGGERIESRFDLLAHTGNRYAAPVWRDMIDALVAEVQEEGR